MKNKLNILFLGGGKRVSLASYFLEWGQKNNTEVTIYGYELDENVPLREVANIIIGKKWNQCLEHIQDIVDQKRIDIVLPFVDPAIEICAQLTGTFAPVSEVSICSIFFSKINTQEWCIENNIPFPRYIENQFPVIAKPDKGSASKGIEIIPNAEALDSFFKTKNREEYVIQKFIQAREYTVDAYKSTSHGNMNYLIPRLRIETQGGEAIKSQTLSHPEIEKISRRVIDTSGLSGAITLQFLEDIHSGEIYFMEVNPRFGGGVVTSYGAGIDLAGIVIADLNKEKIEENNQWEKGLLMIRKFQELFIHANHH
jgi:carbamoyl-phosphate synthase large subunit